MPLNLIDALTDATVKTEGLLPGQTPLRIGATRYKNTVQGYPLDWAAHALAPKERKGFYFVSPDNVPLVIRKQWKNYFIDPPKYGLSEESTIADAIKLFDQENPKNKLKILDKQGIDTNIKIKDAKQLFDLSKLNPFAATEAYAGEGTQETQMPMNPLLEILLRGAIPGATFNNAVQQRGGDPSTVFQRPTTAQPSAPTQMPQQPQPAPMPQVPPQVMPQQSQPNLDANGQTPFGRFLSQMGIPLATAAVGLASPAALPGAAGFQTGFVGEKQRQRTLKEETAAKDDSYKMAIDLSKTGPFGGIEVTTPEHINELAKRIYSIRYGGGHTNPAGSQTSGFNFNSVEEAEKANLPKGTKITVNGRTAEIQ